MGETFPTRFTLGSSRPLILSQSNHFTTCVRTYLCPGFCYKVSICAYQVYGRPHTVHYQIHAVTMQFLSIVSNNTLLQKDSSTHLKLITERNDLPLWYRYGVLTCMPCTHKSHPFMLAWSLHCFFIRWNCSVLGRTRYWWPLAADVPQQDQRGVWCRPLALCHTSPAAYFHWENGLCPQEFRKQKKLHPRPGPPADQARK